MEKYTLITGATSGLGKELSYIYASNKNNLFLVSRNEKELSSLQEEIINKYSVEVKILAMDLSVVEDYSKIKKDIMLTYGFQKIFLFYARYYFWYTGNAVIWNIDV